jgi:hypothetical protein
MKPKEQQVEIRQVVPFLYSGGGVAPVLLTVQQLTCGTFCGSSLLLTQRFGFEKFKILQSEQVAT